VECVKAFASTPTDGAHGFMIIIIAAGLQSG
jgi:hypothetical protein